MPRAVHALLVHVRKLDALGRYQTAKGERPIDTQVDDIPVAEEPMSFADHLELIELLSDSRIVSDCFARNMAAFVAGTADDETLDGLTVLLVEATAELGDEVPVTEMLGTLLSTPEPYTRRWSTQADATEEEN